MCPRCEADPQPENFGDRRKCAFDAEGKFTPDNWNCATLNAMIGDAETTTVTGSDEQFEYTPGWEDGETHGWVITTRYKRRGCTSSAIYVGDFFPPEPLTLERAESIITARARFEQWRKEHPE